jgi:two-component system sensor histidine kinase SenX3
VGILSRKAAQTREPQFDTFEQVASQVVDVIATAGVVLDQSNLVRRASPGAVQFGLISGRRLIHEPLIDLVNRSRQTSGAVAVDVELEAGLNKDQVWFHARAAKFSDRYVMLLIDDLTEAKKLEETRRDFVANVSHELKTPIGAISLLSEAIAGAKGDPAAIEKFAESLQKESQRLANIVQELIQLSRVQGANLSETIEEIDLATVIADGVDRNQTLANQRGVRLASTTNVSVKMQGDYEMLVTAVRNLIENAIVYSEPNSQVGVGLRVVEDVAEISVTDSGLGIPESEQDRIFERFYRVDPSRSRETGGTGLGLSIVKHAAFHHRGEIKLFSKPGVGSTFTLRLPINKKEEN